MFLWLKVGLQLPESAKEIFREKFMSAHDDPNLFMILY